MRVLGLVRTVVVIAWMLCAVLLVGGCSCSATDVLAQLTETNGEVTRDEHASLGQWRPADLGAEFRVGDGVRTSPASTGVVEFDDGAKLRLEPSTTVRFLETPPGTDERGVDVITGDAILETGATELRLRTRIGLAVLESGSLVRVSKTNSGLRFQVKLGLARLGEGDRVTTVEPGSVVQVGIGMAVFEREDATEGSTDEGEQSAATLPQTITAAVKGKGVLIRPEGQKRYTRLPKGEHILQPGSRLKLNKGSRASLTFGKQSAELKGPGTYVVRADPDRFVEPVAGVTVLAATEHDVSLAIPGGRVIAKGSEGRALAEVTVRGKQADVFVKLGKVDVEVGGQRESLTAGERARIRGGKLTVSGRGPGFADLSVGAGNSLLVHDPRPPTAVSVAFEQQCEGVGIVERVRGGAVKASASGIGSASLHFKRGQHDYRVRCLSLDGKLSAPMARGRITVLRDAGTAALAKTPPVTSINVDGRSYTVLYQNRLPAVNVRWPNAPEAAAYTLTVTSGSESFSVATKSPGYAFPTGKLREGRHTFRFKGSNGRASRVTTTSIRFDNAAPTASIKSPHNGSFQGGTSVTASGVALPGWTVSAGSEPLSLDSHHRFSQRVAAGERGLVLKFVHPRRGTHHYLRRAAGIQQ